MVLEQILHTAPHLMEKIISQLDGLSTRRMLWVSKDVRQFTKGYLQSQEGKKKDSRFAIKTSIPPAVITLPGSDECNFGQSPSDAWDHSKADYLNDNPPDFSEVLTILSGAKDVENFASDICRFPGESGKIAKQTLTRGSAGLFGCSISDGANYRKVKAFRTNREENQIAWEAPAGEFPCVQTVDVAACISETGSYILVVSSGGLAVVQRFADGKKIAEKIVQIDRRATISVGAQRGEVILAEDSLDYSMIQTFGDQTLDFRKFAVLKTGKSPNEFSANIAVVGGCAVQLLQSPRCIHLTAFEIDDLILRDKHMDDSLYFPRRRFVCNITDLPGSFIMERNLPSWRLLEGEFCGPNGGDKLSPKEKESRCTTRLYFVGYPRTLFLLWSLQRAKAKTKIICKIAGETFVI